jgi:membrane protein
VIKQVGTLILQSGRNWIDDNASTLGASLAFYCAFSLAPLLVILLSIAQVLVGATSANAELGAQLTSLFGPATAKILLDAVTQSREFDGVLATIVSVVTLLISATTVLAALDAALQQIWKTPTVLTSGWRGWVRTRFLSFGFILALGFLLLASLTLTTALASLEHRISGNDGLVGLVAACEGIFSLILVAALFTVFFRYMPAKHLPWRIVAAGGVLTAVLFYTGRWAIGIYLARSTQASAFGAAASFAALLLWLYYTAQIFLFGAEFTACLGGLRKEDERPANH